MFAFVIWDEENKEMFVARDRLGKKPLYYFFDGVNILFASEIKSLLASGILTPEIDYKSIDNYLKLMYVLPWKSIYKNIHQIPPAYCGLFKDGKLSLNRYWKLVYRPVSVSYDEAKTEVHRLLRQAVKKRLKTADVEVGSFLSGGVDSSLITLIAAKELASQLKVFSVSYKGHDELAFAKEVSDKIGSELFTVNIDGVQVSELERINNYFDEPHSDTSDFPQHLVSKLASEKVKVVLSGDGADELFLGYKWHLKSAGVELFDRRANSICAFDSICRHSLWGSALYINEDVFPEIVYGGFVDQINKVTIFDVITHLPGQILTKVDRASMMHGLEVRISVS